MVDTILTFINGIVLKGNAKSLDVPFWSYFSWKKIVLCDHGTFSPDLDGDLWPRNSILVRLVTFSC